MILSSKIALLDKIKRQPFNTSHRRLAELTGVPKSTISRLIQQENQRRYEWALREGQAETPKRKCGGKDPDVEEALDQWFSIVTGRGMNISGPVLKAKSEELAKKLGHNNFTATEGYHDGKLGITLNLRKHRQVRRTVLIKLMLKSGNLQKFLFYCRIFVRMTSTMPMKPVSIIVPRRMVLYAINTINCPVKKWQWIV